MHAPRPDLKASTCNLTGLKGSIERTLKQADLAGSPLDAPLPVCAHVSRSKLHLSSTGFTRGAVVSD